MFGETVRLLPIMRYFIELNRRPFSSTRTRYRPGHHGISGHESKIIHCGMAVLIFLRFSTELPVNYRPNFRRNSVYVRTCAIAPVHENEPPSLALIPVHMQRKSGVLSSDFYVHDLCVIY